MSSQEQKDELWDLYDEERRPTGKKHRRSEPLGPGEYHLVVHVCIFNSRGELLIQQRQTWKESWAGMWDISAAGSALAGEDSRSAAVRETREELGIEIDLDGERPRFTVNVPGGFDDYYFVETELELEELTLQEEEVRDVRWAGPEEIRALLEEERFVPYFFMDRLFEMKDVRGSKLSEKKK